ncbi:hypothetical protein [Planctomycetes bacterium K23_9]|uniref:Uncharacterized protein n=1 Tax=Stieleria marina TaxID=1930275 RepID=A0A517NXL8_9BACT|nr:hypothetical protein K239x_38750 [Planctomycetes bacterium K23_9]
MSVSVYYRSIESMHPAQAFEVRDAADRFTTEFDWLTCDSPRFEQEKDGYLSGNVMPVFDCQNETEESADRLGGLYDAIEVLRQLSQLHGVDWEIWHDYEPQGIGKIINGAANLQLTEEIDSVVQIGNLFGEVGFDEEELEEEQETTPQGFGVWRATIHETSADYARQEPRVLKFPGVK